MLKAASASRRPKLASRNRQSRLKRWQSTSGESGLSRLYRALLQAVLTVGDEGVHVEEQGCCVVGSMFGADPHEVFESSGEQAGEQVVTAVVDAAGRRRS
jgi:hypothetical protein